MQPLHLNMFPFKIALQTVKDLKRFVTNEIVFPKLYECLGVKFSALAYMGKSGCFQNQ